MTEVDQIRRILIFDDDQDLRNLVSVYLAKLFPGVDVEQYDPLASGEPDEKFDWSKYDVLILDYFLCIHGVTGLDILHRNRKNPDFPATIMLTGAGNEEVAVRALKAGVYDYLRKQSLDKQQLHDSVIKAFVGHSETKQQKQEATQQGQAFNKSLFYQQLEFHKDLPEYRDRALLLIDLDAHLSIAEREGVILRDNIIRHIAKQSFEIFKLGETNPSVTRLGDASIALLIDMPDSVNTLEFNMKGLLNHLSKRPFKFGDKKINFTVSIGVLQLSGDGEAKDSVLEKVKNACITAKEIDGNSFYIYGSVSETLARQKADAKVPEPVEKPLKPETLEADVEPEFKLPPIKKSAVEPPKVDAPAPIAEKKPVPPAKLVEPESAKQAAPAPKKAPELELTPVKIPEPEPAKPSAPAPEKKIELELTPVKATEPKPAKPEPSAPTPEKKTKLELTPVKATEPEPAKPAPPAPVPKKETAPEESPAKATEPEQVKPPEPVTKTATTPTPPVQKAVPASPVVSAKSQPAPAELRPKKSLEELKAEREKAKIAVHENPVTEQKVELSETSHVSADEVDLESSTLDDSARALKKAFDEQRVIQAYQPVISLLNEEMDSDDEIHSISLQLVDEDGSTKSEEEILGQVNTVEFKKFVDHWLLREVIGYLSNKQKTTDTFILKISDASLADAGFFNWLRKLLTGLEAINPGKYIALQIKAEDLVSLEKQAGALISYLRKSHDFKFVLGDIENAAQVADYSSRIKFDLIRCKHTIISELNGLTIDSDKTTEDGKNISITQLDLIKSHGTRFIADDVENATTLTEAITSGVEYAMGEFIGEPVTQVDEMTNIETFEIV